MTIFRPRAFSWEDIGKCESWPKAGPFFLRANTAFIEPMKIYRYEYVQIYR